MLRFDSRAKSECFGCSINPEVREVTVERFESAYVLFFIKAAGDGKLLGKNAMCQMIVFSRLNKVIFFLTYRGFEARRDCQMHNKKSTVLGSTFCYFVS